MGTKLRSIGDALSFKLDEPSRRVISELLQQVDADTDRIDKAARRIEGALSPFETLIQLLETLPGVRRGSAMGILIELGTDMAAFPSARHCAAGAGLFPGNNENAGKRRSGRTRRANPTLRAIPIECAHAAVRTQGGPFQSDHEAVKSRRGHKRAVIAAAHKRLRVIDARLRDGTPYTDPGIDDEAIEIDRKAARWLKKLQPNGYVNSPHNPWQNQDPDMPEAHA